MTGFLQTYRGVAFGGCFVPMALIDFFTLVGIGIWFIILKQKKKRLAAEDDINLPSYETQNGEENGFVKKQMHPSIVQSLRSMRKLFFGVLLANFGWIVLMLTAFDILTIYAGMPILIIYAWFCYFLLIPEAEDKVTVSPTLFDEDKIQKVVGRVKFFWKNRVKAVEYHARTNAVVFFGGMLALLIVVFVLVFFTWGMCVAWDPIEVTTRFTRSLDTQICTSDNDPPCHVYITYPENPSTSIIINFQTKSNPSKSTPPTVYFDLVSHAGSANLSAYGNKTTGKSHEYSSCDITRGINYVLLTGLQPDTVYFFRAGYGSDEKTYSAEKKFRTPPATGPFTFVAGGDMSVGDTAKTMLGFAAAQDPYFAAVGGDIAYANAFPSCYKRWDKWLDNWEKLMYMSDGSYIPMMLAIGNHEAGGFDVPYSLIPFYLNWFAQSSNMDLDDRDTYHTHVISDTTAFLVLDSNIGSPAKRDQVDWMKDQLSTNLAAYPNRLATYHVPLYPSFRSPDSQPSKQLRDDWLGVFAEYNLTVSFENHDHTYKRTKLLRNNEVCDLDSTTNDNTTCTLFMGDGAWGVTPRSSIKHRWYLENTKGINHIMRVDVGTTYMNITVIDKEGEVFDSTVK
eukprot:CAMPEP_0168542832 /NCGR_PEP_ID=MMETSP0413-20121227/1555_1 /TAXON_ID=136452 /ORGANISM="Filamoeba nolandi, Strain NC-AS-23-1" /LENGTH=620 /DNA_ID=CAMNT_0008572729 /DNA_START=36 /DNA_END=1895 /DNA_ORIENTATION=-